MGKYQKPPYYGTLKETVREEDLRLAGEDRSSKKWAGAGMNYGSWQLIEGEIAHIQPMFLKEQWTLLYIHDRAPLPPFPCPITTTNSPTTCY
jgi:hypothetical protein